MKKTKVINGINIFYEIVKMSAEAWILLLRNFLVYGWLDATCYLTSYLMQPTDQRDSFIQFKQEHPLNLKYRKGVSFVLSIILFGWLASYIYLMKNGQTSSFISLMFCVLTIWLIIGMIYLSVFGLVWANNKYDDDKQYYAQTFIQIMKNPLITITVLTLWLLSVVVSIRCFILIFLVVPGLIVEAKVSLYKKLEEQDKLK